MSTSPRGHWTLIPPVEFVIYLAVRMVLMTVQIFPRRHVRMLGIGIGRLARLLDRRHVRIARKNLERSGLVAPRDVDPLITRVFEEIATTFAELLMVPRIIAQRRLASAVHFEGLEFLERARQDGRGAILVIGHQGNYELVGLAAKLAGFPLTSIARPIVNRYLDRWLTRLRTSTGLKIIPRDGALAGMFRTLRENGAIVVQIDQDAKRSGVRVNFFGRPASAHGSPALLSLRCGSPIIFAEIHRAGDANHCTLRLSALPAEFHSQPDAVRAMTQRVTTELELSIRKRPEQWWWILDRWKSVERESVPSPARRDGLERESV